MGKDYESRLKNLEDQVNSIILSLQKVHSFSQNDPETALTHARKSAESICQYIFIQEYKSSPDKFTLEQFILKLGNERKIFSPKIIASLRTIQSFCNIAVHSGEKIDKDYLAPVLDALSILVGWYFEGYKNDKNPFESTYFERPLDEANKKVDKTSDNIDLNKDIVIQMAGEELIGEEVGNYRIQKLLGKGGYGSVYRAAHKNTKNEVAIKISHSIPTEKNKLKSLLLGNARALSGLRNPNIVSLLDFGEFELYGRTRIYMVYELIEGITLSNLTGSFKSKLEIKKAIKLILQIYSAIEAAHSFYFYDSFGFEVQGIVHGDIKPANIFLCKGKIIKVSDFMSIDFNSLLNEKKKEYIMQENSTREFGTPGYMPPEQSEKGVATKRSDIYFLGKTIYEILSGQNPFGIIKQYLVELRIKNKYIPGMALQYNR